MAAADRPPADPRAADPGRAPSPASVAEGDALLLGVSSWLARGFGIPSGVVRIAFVVLAVAGGVGVLLYALGWLLMRRDPDLVARPHRADASDLRATLAVVMIVLGVLLVVRRLGLGFSDALVWPVAVVGAGLAFVWPQLGDRGVTALLGGLDVDDDRASRPAQLARWVGGTALVVLGLVLFLATNQSAEALRDGIVTVVVILGGLLLLFGSWVRRLVRSLVDERRQRIRSDERATVAAHLHDSVLQTLALIQHRSDDPAAVARLARRQERELRRWLYDPGHQLGLGLRQLIEAQVEQIEDQHLIDVETVIVGDTRVDEATTALVAAASEALVNAAKFSGEERISLYVEVSDEAIDVFIRDRGIGFDLDAVAADRHGVRDSIMGRMERIGGTVELISEPGAGTEVELRLPRGAGQVREPTP